MEETAPMAQDKAEEQAESQERLLRTVILKVLLSEWPEATED